MGRPYPSAVNDPSRRFSSRCSIRSSPSGDPVAAPIELVFDLARDIDFHQRSMAHTGEQAVGRRRPD
jgi:hypothetical protein